MEKALTLLAAVQVFLAPLSHTFGSPPPKVVCVDPGHGGDDPGAVNGNLTEVEVTLNIANRFKTLLEQNGYKVVMTRSDTSTGHTNSERAQICNENKADVLVSIHLNSSIDTTLDYTQALYGNATKDKKLATAMHQELLSDLGIPNPEKDAVTDFQDNLLLKANMPATLQETVFISSPTEDTKLANGSRQQQIAQSLYTGIDKWFKEK